MLANLSNPEHPVMEVPDGRITFEHVDFSYSAPLPEGAGREGGEEPPLLPAGHIAAALPNISIILVWELLNKFVGACHFAHPDAVLLCGIFIAPPEVFQNSAGKQHILLEHY